MARIATITSGPPTGSGGTDRHLSSLVRFLEGDGHEVDCYHFEQLKPPRPWTWLDRIGFRHPGHGYHLYRRAQASPRPYDLFFVNSFLGAYVPGGVPTINVFHSCDAAFADLSFSWKHWKEYIRGRFVWSYFEKRSARRHYSVAVSRSVARELLHYYRVRANETIPYCVDTNLFAPAEKEAARARLGIESSLPVVLFAGSWSYRKGADLVSHLAERLAGRAKFVAAASNGEWNVPFPENILSLPALKPQEMPVAYQAADIFLFPTRAESFGFVTAEAMACGLPVVSTQVGVGEELARDPEVGPYFLPSPARRDQLFSHMDELLTHSDKRTALGAYGRDLIKRHYSIEAFNENYRLLLKRFGISAVVPG